MRIEGLTKDEAMSEEVKEKKARKPRRRRTDTKEAQVIELLQRKEGATLEDICTTTGWKKDTARGVLSGLRRQRNLNVVHEKPLGAHENIYYIVPEVEAAAT